MAYVENCTVSCERDIPCPHAITTASASGGSVLHLDPDPLWAQLVAEVIARLPRLVYLGTRSSSIDGLSVCREQRPWVLVLDLCFADGDGLKVIDQLVADERPPRIIVVSARSDDYALFRVWQSNVSALIWKTGGSRDHLEMALSAVVHGKRYFPAEVAEAVRKVRTAPNAFFKILSKKELLLMPALCEGRSDAAIAQEVGLSRHTIHSHRQRILGKLDLDSTMALMAWGRDRGFSPRMQSAPSVATQR